jgi:hypothetical protein
MDMYLNRKLKKDYSLERISYYSFFFGDKPVYICGMSSKAKLVEVKKLRSFIKKRGFKLMFVKGRVARIFNKYKLGAAFIVGSPLVLVVGGQGVFYLKAIAGLFPVFLIWNGVVCWMQDVILFGEDAESVKSLDFFGILFFSLFSWLLLFLDFIVSVLIIIWRQ